MAYKTIRKRVALYLVAMGKVKVPSPYFKYDMYKGEDSTICYFLGKSGAVRLSGNGKLKGSYNVKETMLKRVKEWEQSHSYYVFDKEIGF